MASVRGRNDYKPLGTQIHHVSGVPSCGKKTRKLRCDQSHRQPNEMGTALAPSGDVEGLWQGFQVRVVELRRLRATYIGGKYRLTSLCWREYNVTTIPPKPIPENALDSGWLAACNRAEHENAHLSTAGAQGRPTGANISGTSCRCSKWLVPMNRAALHACPDEQTLRDQ